MTGLVTAVAIGEWFVKPAVERNAAAALQRRYELSTEPTVKLSGFPFIFRALLGRVPTASFEAEGLVQQGLKITKVDGVAHRLRFSITDAASGDPTITAGTVAAKVTVTEADLSSFLRARGELLKLSFSPGGVTVEGSVFVAGNEFTGTATGDVKIVDSLLTFTATELSALGVRVPDVIANPIMPEFDFEVVLPDFVGVRADELEFSDGVVVLGASGTDVTLT